MDGAAAMKPFEREWEKLQGEHMGRQLSSTTFLEVIPKATSLCITPGALNEVRVLLRAGRLQPGQLFCENEWVFQLPFLPW